MGPSKEQLEESRALKLNLREMWRVEGNLLDTGRSISCRRHGRYNGTGARRGHVGLKTEKSGLDVRHDLTLVCSELAASWPSCPHGWDLYF